jgi:hypothetical protein
MELWGFFKSLVLYLSVYMEHSLEGYMVNTTAGFPVKIVEALAPSSRHQIPWKCPHYHMRICSTHH